MTRVRGRGYGHSQDNVSRTLCGVEHLELVEFGHYVDVRSPTVVEVTKTTFPLSERMVIRELMYLVPFHCIRYVNRKGE